MVPTTWLLFAITYTRRAHWITPRRLFLLAIEPVVTLALAFTNDSHGLIWSHYRLQVVDTFVVKVSTHGSWFWLHTAYSYALLLLGTLLIFEALIRSRRLYRGQALALTIFALTPWLGNVLYLSGFNPFPHLDLTPFAFAMTGPVLAWGLYKFRLGDLVPVAYATIIRHLNDAVIVLDGNDRIIDLNPSAEQFANIAGSKAIGQPVNRVFPALSDHLQKLLDERDSAQEVAVDNGGLQRFYDAKLSPVVDRRGGTISSVLSLRDITERKHIENDLRQHREKLEELVQERTAELASANEQLLDEITERRHAEEAIRLSEERYQKILDASHDMVLVADDSARVLFANRAYREVTGYSVEDVNEVGILETIHPDDEKITREKFSGALNGVPVRNLQYRRIGKNGEVRWGECNADPIDWPGAHKAAVNIARDITERKLAEETLRLSEERHRNILDTTHDMIFVMDMTAKIVYANKALRTNMTYTLEEINSLDIFITVHDHDCDIVKSWFRRAMSGESGRSIQYRILRKNREIRWMEANANPIQWPGLDRTILVVVRDITDRKQAEQDLISEKERAQRYLDIAEVMLVAVDADAKVVLINRKGCDILGYEENEIVGRSWFDNFLPERTREELRKVFGKLKNGEGEHIKYYENPVLTKGGEERIIAWHNSVLTDNAGNFISILASGEDVTLRKWVETALRESEQKFRSLVEATSDWVWETDPYGDYVYASPRVKDLLGYEPHEVIGRRPFDFMPPNEAERLESFFRDSSKLGRSFSGLENVNIHKDGSLVVIETNAVPFFDKDGNLLGYRGIDRNISARKQAEEKLRQSEERYRNIFYEAPDIFYILDLETWIVTEANKHALEACEYSPDVLGRLHVSQIIHPDDYERAANRLRDMVIKQDRMPQFPLRILTRTGKVRHIEQTGVIFWDENGNAKTFLGLAHDVTERIAQQEAIRKQNERLTALYEVARAANETRDLRSLLNAMVEILPRITNAANMGILSIDEGTQTVNYAAHFGLPDEFVQGTSGLKADTGLLGYVMKTRKPLLIPNINEHEMLAERSYVEKLNIEGVIMVPLVVKDKVIGFLIFARGPGNPYTEEDFELITAIGNQLAVAIENASLYSELQHREARLQSILETSLDGIGVFSNRQRLIYRNKALSSMFGYTDTEDVSDIDTAHFFSRESLPALFELRDRLARGEKITECIQYKALRKDGSTFDVETRVGSFVEGDQRFDVAVVRDVTERMRMQSELQQQKAHLESILETSQDGIVLFCDRRPIYRNKSIASMLGYDESHDTSAYDADSHIEPEGYELLQWVRQKIDNREKIDKTLEFKGKRRDGTTFDAEVRVGFFYEKEKRYVVIVVRDVTERKRMESQLHQASKLAAIGELASGVAHEINNPIANIDIQTGLIHDILEEERDKLDAAFSEALQQYLRTLEEQVRRCQSITNELLSFSRSAEGKQETFSINDLVKKTAEMMAHLTEKDPDFHLVLDTRIPLFRGDRSQLEQVFVNLVNNALKAIDPHGSITILTRRESDGSIQIEFRDSGHGIPPEIRDRIFEPFFTTRPAGEGTGLGLSISYYIIKQMDGTIHAGSSPGQGAAFIISLPCATQTPGEYKQ